MRIAHIVPIALTMLLLPRCVDAQVPTLLGQWGSKGSGPGQFSYPIGICVDPAGTVYVADSYNRRVQLFSAAGVFVNAWVGSNTYDDPADVAVNGAGEVFVIDQDNGRIERVYRFRRDGTLLGSWGDLGAKPGQFNGAQGIAVGPGGDVYVADTFNHRVQRFTAGGTLLACWGSYGDGAGQFEYPSDVAVDPAGDVFVVDPLSFRVQEFSATGAWLRAWSAGDRARGYRPHSVAVDAFGDVYVSGGRGVQEFTGDGTPLVSWTVPGVAVDLAGITVAGDGTIYVVDGGQSIVSHYGYVVTAAPGVSWGRLKSLYR